MTATAEELRAKAAECAERSEESFQRCDTDGFLSQWANDLTARLYRTQADLVDNGGVDEFLGLCKIATGERVRAKIIRGRFGPCWAIVGEDDKFTGEFFPTGPRSRKQKAAGLCEKPEMAPAGAKIDGQGTGLSGSAWVAIYRTDGGCPEGAVTL